MSDIRHLQNGIEDRQQELRGLVPTLAKRAYVLQTLSNGLKVATILLSAVTSVKGVADTIYGRGDSGVMVAFAAISVATTVLIGLEAAFKFEKRAAELTVLSASARGTVISVDSEWRQTIGSSRASDLRDAARKILNRQDAALAEIHQKAASLGVNLSLGDHALEEPDSGKPPLRPATGKYLA